MHPDSYQEQAAHYLFNTYARYAITLMKGEGAFVWDSQGKKYLDFLCGIGCTPLGHCHPALTQAVIEQVKKIWHTSNLYYSPPNIELAQCLVEAGGLDKVFFCNSGAEANEAAIKLVRKYHWRRGDKHKNVILSAAHSFHGRTFGALAATAKPEIHEGFGPLPQGFKYQSWQDTDAFCQAIDDSVAAVMLEPIQGEGGIHIPAPGFLKAVRAACEKQGALLIFDEVQCGMGRTGELFAYQHAGVIPDVITLAKGIANGLPLGAVCAKADVANALKPGDHGTTFGGNPVSCVAALATIQILKQPSFLARLKQLSAYLAKQLHQLQKQHPDQLLAIRGTGMMIGLELASHPREILQQCQQAGLLANITANHILRLLPPFIINEADIDFAVNVIADSLKKAITLKDGVAYDKK